MLWIGIFCGALSACGVGSPALAQQVSKDEVSQTSVRADEMVAPHCVGRIALTAVHPIVRRLSPAARWFVRMPARPSQTLGQPTRGDLRQP